MIPLLALDTNAYAAWGRGDVTLAKHISQAVGIGLSVTVLGEIHFGTMNGSQQTHNNAALTRFLANNRVEILQIDTITAKLYGEIATQLRQAGKPIQQNDIWIAALCKQYNYALATRDAGFQSILGLDILDF